MYLFSAILFSSHSFNCCPGHPLYDSVWDPMCSMLHHEENKEWEDVFIAELFSDKKDIET